MGRSVPRRLGALLLAVAAVAAGLTGTRPAGAAVLSTFFFQNTTTGKCLGTQDGALGDRLVMQRGCSSGGAIRLSLKPTATSGVYTLSNAFGNFCVIPFHNLTANGTQIVGSFTSCTNDVLSQWQMVGDRGGNRFFYVPSGKPMGVSTAGGASAEFAPIVEDNGAGVPIRWVLSTTAPA